MTKETTWLPLYLKPQWNIHTQYTMYICTHIHNHILAISALTSCHVRVDLFTGLTFLFLVIILHIWSSENKSFWTLISANYMIGWISLWIPLGNTPDYCAWVIVCQDGYVLIIFCCSAYLSGLGILSQGFFCCCSQHHYTRSHQNYSASYHSIVI